MILDLASVFNTKLFLRKHKQNLKKSSFYYIFLETVQSGEEANISFDLFQESFFNKEKLNCI